MKEGIVETMDGCYFVTKHACENINKDWLSYKSMPIVNANEVIEKEKSMKIDCQEILESLNELKSYLEYQNEIKNSITNDIRLVQKTLIEANCPSFSSRPAEHPIIDGILVWDSTIKRFDFCPNCGDRKPLLGCSFETRKKVHAIMPDFLRFGLEILKGKANE